MALNSTFTQVLERRPRSAVHGHRRPRHVLHRRRSTTTSSRGCGERRGRFEEASADLGAAPWQTFRLRHVPAAALGAGRRRAARLRAVLRRGDRHDVHRRRPARRCRSGSSPTCRGPNQLPIVNVVGVVGDPALDHPRLLRPAAHGRPRRHAGRRRPRRPDGRPHGPPRLRRALRPDPRDRVARRGLGARDRRARRSASRSSRSTCRGSGGRARRSQRPTIDRQTDAFAGWLARRGADGCHVGGNSMGGAIALELAPPRRRAQRRGDRARGLLDAAGAALVPGLAARARRRRSAAARRRCRRWSRNPAGRTASGWQVWAARGPPAEELVGDGRRGARRRGVRRGARCSTSTRSTTPRSSAACR